MKFGGVLEGLKLSKRLGLRRMEVNVDSEVVKAIQREGSSNPSCFALIREIKKLIEEHDIVIISHIYRKVNACADALAKMGSLDKESRVFVDILEALVSLLGDDKASFIASLEVYMQFISFWALALFVIRK